MKIKCKPGLKPEPVYTKERKEGSVQRKYIYIKYTHQTSLPVPINQLF